MKRFDKTEKEILKIGGMLGLKEEDIIELKKIALNQENMQNVLVQEPADGYNNAVGYYGTVSIKDF